MARTLKNTTGSAISIKDTGVTIPASPGAYEIPSQDYLIWAASTDVAAPISAGDLVVNNGNTDLSASIGAAYLKLEPIAVGGSTSHVLTKQSGADYHIAWQAIPPAPNGIPSGGTANQILEKIDGTDYNTQWINNAATTPQLIQSPTTGLNQVLANDDGIDFKISPGNVRGRLSHYSGGWSFYTQVESGDSVITSGSTKQFAMTGRYSYPGDGGGIQFLRSKGTEDSPTAVANLSQLCNINIKAHDGTDYVAAAQQYFEVSGTPATNKIPTKFYLRTGNGVDAGLKDRITILPSGHTGINNPTPLTHLDVVGSIKITDSGVTQPGVIKYASGDIQGHDGTQWRTLVNKVPTGGSSAQVLTKNSATDYDASWATPAVFGSQYENFSDVTTFTTNSGTYLDAASFQTGALPDGTYRVGLTWRFAGDSLTKIIDFQATFDGTTAYNITSYELQDYGDLESRTIFFYVTTTGGPAVKWIRLATKTEGSNIVYVYEVFAEIWRIS